MKCSVYCFHGFAGFCTQNSVHVVRVPKKYDLRFYPNKNTVSMPLNATVPPCSVDFRNINSIQNDFAPCISVWNESGACPLFTKMMNVFAVVFYLRLSQFSLSNFQLFPLQIRFVRRHYKIVYCNLFRVFNSLPLSVRVFLQNFFQKFRKID